MAKKGILVTGATGLIGSHVAAQLARLGHCVRATDHSRAGSPSLPYEWMWADLRDPKYCSEVVWGQDIVVMCAAVTSGAYDMANNPLRHVRDNVVMNMNMINEAYRAGVQRFVFISSSTVYPVTPADSDLGFHEAEHMPGIPAFGNPPNSYWWVSRMKRYMEQLCYSYAEKLAQPMGTLIIRPSNTYGPNDKFLPKSSHFIGNKIREIVSGVDPIILWGDGTDERDYIYVEDLARAIVALTVSEDDDFHQIYNVGSSQSYTTMQVTETIREICNSTADIVCDLEKPTTAHRRLINSNRAWSAVPGYIRYTLRDGLAKTIDWYKREGYLLKR